MIDTLILIVMATGAYQVGKYVLSNGPLDGLRTLRSRRQQRLRFRQQRRRQHAVLNLLARNLQVSLLQLAASPDFRKAAAHAEAARDVPVAFRQRQFQRFRPQLIDHVRRCTAKGTPAETLNESLTALVEALGMPAYDADYILQQASRTKVTPAAPASYTQQLEQAHRQHQERLAALEQLSIEAELKEQLIENEHGRFRGEMLQNRESHYD